MKILNSDFVTNESHAKCGHLEYIFTDSDCFTNPLKSANSIFKGTVSRDFLPFFCFIKRLHLGGTHVRTDKNSFTKIFTKNVCPRSQRLCGHCVSIVNGYTYTQEIVILWKK